MGAPIFPVPLLHFTQVMGHPRDTVIPYAKAVVGKHAERFLSEIFMVSCISAYAIFGSLVIRDSTPDTFSGIMVPNHSVATVVVFLHYRARHALFKLVALDGD